MKWSWKLGQIRGIGIYLHCTFLLLIVWVLSSQLAGGANWLAALAALGFMLALFGVIVLHELGHALTAAHFGIRTRSITLLPIGGVAEMERMPDKPGQELLVALAGPAVNLALALLIYLALGLTQAQWGWPALDEAGFWPRLLGVNLGLALFNLLPAFPMDGGRALRALLALRLGHLRATTIAADIGQAMAIGFGLLGLLFNPMLLFIAFFVWVGAAAEEAQTRVRSFTQGVPLEQIMIRSFRELPPQASLREAADCLSTGFQTDFPIVGAGRLLGILRQQDLLEALLKRDPETAVAEVMQTTYEAVAPDAQIEQVLPQLDGAELLPVLRQGRLVGLVTRQSLGEWMLLEAIRRQRLAQA